MNTILKAFFGVSLAYTFSIVMFWNFFTTLPGFVMFISTYLVLTLVTMYDEFIKPSGWPVKTGVYEERHGSMRYYETRAKREKAKDGKYKYKLQKGGITKPIDTKHIMNLKTGFRGEDMLLLYSPGPEQYHPINMSDKEKTKELNVIPSELINFIIDTEKGKWESHPDRQKGWEKVLGNPVVIAGAVMMLFIATVIGTMIYWQEIITPMIHEGKAMLGLQVRQSEIVEKYNQLLDERMEKLGMISKKEHDTSEPEGEVQIPFIGQEE